MKKSVAKSGAEHDWISKTWRKLLCYLGRPGVGKKLKKQMVRRQRRMPIDDY